MQARDTYEAGRSLHDREWAVLDARSRRLGLVLFAVIAALGLLAVLGCGGMAKAWWGVGGLAVTVAALAIHHARVVARQERAAASRRFHELGLSRLDGTWRRTAHGGERFRSPDHLYTDDLDVFGEASLFGHLDATKTRLGEERLAALLRGEGLGRFPEDVLARAEAVRELAANVRVREALFRAGESADGETGVKLDAASAIAWGERAPDPAGGQGGAWRAPGARVAAAVLAGAAIAAVVAHYAWDLPAVYPLAVIGAELALSRVLRSKTRGALDGISAWHVAAVRYEELLALVESEKWTAPLLREYQARLAPSPAGPGAPRARAALEVGRLARIVSFVNARENGVFRTFVGPILLWDVQWAMVLYRWRDRAGSHLRAWFETVGEVEALVSLAGFAFDRPDHAWPELVPEPAFDARALAHPLIAADVRVGNDVRVSREVRALLLTGSNMSGKSTLLRAIGTNAVLALAGAPVCASSLSMGPMRVATSMRVRDSLDQKISHFYAELLRLKTVIDASFTPSDGVVFFLLDEILHGTNSRERVLGGRSVVRRLLRSESLGVVSTHDLGLSGLEVELGGRVRNAHFEEQLDGGRMTFDYKLRKGAVQSSNALRLMQQVGIDVSDALSEAAET